MVGEQYGNTELKISVSGLIVDEEKEKFEKKYKSELQAKLKKDVIKREFDGFTYGELLLEKSRLDKMQRFSMAGEERLEHDMRKNILSEIIRAVEVQLSDICDVKVGVFMIWIIFTVFYVWIGMILCNLGEFNASTVVILYTIVTSTYIVANVVYYFGSRLMVTSSLKYSFE